MKNLKFIFLLVPFYLLSQDLVKIKNRNINEVYYTLKGDTIKEGSYINYYEYPRWKKKRIVGQYFKNSKTGIWVYYHRGGYIYKQGAYSDNLKQGQWEIFLWNTKIPSSKGKYENDKKIGVWNYYNQNGVIIHKFNHTTNQLVYFVKDEFAISEQPNVAMTLDNHDAVPLGGELALKKYISMEYVYPRKAQLKNISGTVYVIFNVTEKFVKNKFVIKNDPGYGIGKESSRIIEKGPLWIPKKVDGKYVDTNLSIPVITRIQ